MSHYLDCETMMTDPVALKRALMHMDTPIHRNGLPERAVEVHDKPTNLYGFNGDKRPQTADIIVRRNNVQHLANDIGFAKTQDGTYKAIISEFDKTYFNDKWLTKLSTYYGYEKSKIELEARKIQYTEGKDKEGRLQLNCEFKKKNKGLSIKL